MGVGAWLATGLVDAGEPGRGEHGGDDGEGESGRDFGNRVVLVVGELEDELGADEGEDHGQAGPEVDEAVEQPGDEEVQGS